MNYLLFTICLVRAPESISSDGSAAAAAVAAGGAAV